jgi:hypothetical protein
MALLDCTRLNLDGGNHRWIPKDKINHVIRGPVLADGMVKVSLNYGPNLLVEYLFPNSTAATAYLNSVLVQ